MHCRNDSSINISQRIYQLYRLCLVCFIAELHLHSYSTVHGWNRVLSCRAERWHMNAIVNIHYPTTVMRIIKLKIFPVPVNWLVPVNWFLSLFHLVLQYLRMLYIIWSLVRRRVTRRLTRLQTMHNIHKYSETFKNGCGSVAVIFSI